MKPEVEAARDAGLTKVRRGMTPEENAALRKAMATVVLGRTTFTSDHVWAELESLGVKIREPRALGALIEIMRRTNMIAPAGEFRPSTRKECHGRRIQVWRSLVHRDT